MWIWPGRGTPYRERKEPSLTDTFTKLSITVALAERMIAAAVARADELQLPVSVAICDESGVLKAFRRADGAALLSVEVAVSKARSAVGFNLATHEWYDFIKDDGPLALGAPHLPNLIVFGGGYPIRKSGELVGGVGVSGGHYSQDMACAEAALSVLG